MTGHEKTDRERDRLSTSGAADATGSSLVPVVSRPAEPPPASRRRTRRWLWWAVGVGAALVAGLAYLQPWGSAPAVVAVERVAMAPVTRLLAVNGRLAALHSVDLRPLVGGILTQVSVVEGQGVEAGQTLARIDTAAQDTVVRQAIAALDAALVAQEQADATWRRSLALGANVSATTLEADERAVRRAVLEVARLSAVLEQAQVQLDRHDIRAPIAGTVVALDAEPGQLVDTVTVLMTIADLGTLIVETDVDEVHAAQIAPGQVALMRLAGEEVTRRGEVRSVAQRVDAVTGGLAVTIGFDEPVTAPVGLTVTANIVIDARDAALTVPRSSVVNTADGTAVFLASDGVARLRPVRVIDWPAARLIVTDGLAPGDPVIVDAATLAEGQPVRPDAP